MAQKTQNNQKTQTAKTQQGKTTGNFKQGSNKDQSVSSSRTQRNSEADMQDKDIAGEE